MRKDVSCAGVEITSYLVAPDTFQKNVLAIIKTNNLKKLFPFRT